MSSPETPLSHIAGAADTAKIPLVVILGPTAVGKTEIALELAENFRAEIISADSRLFYRGMDVGTAKPTLPERRRVPHHLIDVAEPDEIWSLALFQLEANRAIRDVYIRQRLPFLVGGTGQFVRSIIEGWKPPAVHPNPKLRHILGQWTATVGPKGLHAKLARLDPDAANSIDPSNVRRTVRALEVILSSGIRFSAQRTRGDMLYQTLQLGLIRPRAELYHRIDDRIDQMIKSGLVEEVHGLLDKGYSPDLPTLSAIGYREIVAYLQGKISLDEAIILMKRRTRAFVRRQANWFKENDPDIHWFRVDREVCIEMGKVIMEWLKSIKWKYI